MIFSKGKLEGTWLISPKIFGDNRGYFLERFRHDFFNEKTGYEGKFVQENESLSSKGVLRGLHLQKPPFAQAKLVSVVKGAVLDVIVDIRKKSPTYGQWDAVELNEENKLQFFIPEGFAHGFQTLEDQTIFQYKCSNYYAPEYELGIQWNDPALALPWRDLPHIISEKDQKQSLFNEFQSPF